MTGEITDIRILRMGVSRVLFLDEVARLGHVDREIVEIEVFTGSRGGSDFSFGIEDLFPNVTENADVAISSAPDLEVRDSQAITFDVVSEWFFVRTQRGQSREATKVKDV